MWGPWQVGQMTCEDYCKRAAQWGKALKLLDPSLCLILCGETGTTSWDHQVLQAAIPWSDMHSIHIYTCSNEHIPNVVAPLSAERAIETEAALIDIARIENKIPSSVPQTKICFDEWNVWDPERAPGDKGGEELYTLSDTLAVGVWLNVFIRQSKYVGMANIAQTVNVISPLMTTKTGIVKQATWWPLLLLCKYMRGYTVNVHVNCSAYDGPTQPEWLQGVLTEGASWLDVSACINKEGFVTLAVVNISETKDFAVDLAGVGKEVTVYTVNGPDVKSVNTAENETVKITESTWNGAGKYTFPKHSITMMRWKLDKLPFHIVEGRQGEALDARKLAWVGA